MELYDPIRGQFVRATPEEKIRQRVIRMMVEKLGYPKSLIAVEKELELLTGSSPNRRIDIVCYASLSDGLRPLLLVECKADKLGPEAERQALGYNDAIQAPFIALAGGSAIKTFWREKDKIASVPFLPCFSELVERLLTRHSNR